MFLSKPNPIKIKNILIIIVFIHLFIYSLFKIIYTIKKLLLYVRIHLVNFLSFLNDLLLINNFNI